MKQTNKLFNVLRYFCLTAIITLGVLSVIGTGGGGGGGDKSAENQSDDQQYFFKCTQSDGLETNYVYALGVDTQGNLWIGYGSGGHGVTRYDGNTWTNFTTDDGLARNYVAAIACDKNGNVWFGFGANGNGICKFDGSNWTSYSTADGLETNYVYALGVDTRGNLWIGYGSSGHGATRYDGNNWTNFTTDNGLARNYIAAIAGGKNGNVWFSFGANGNGICKFDGSNWTSYSTADGLETNYVYALGVDTQGNLWIGYGGSGHGVTSYDGNTWTNFTTDDGLAKDYVAAIAGSKNGNVWFSFGANGNGICRIGTAAGADEPFPNTYYIDSDGDGYGNPATFLENSSQPQGYVLDNTDCDDTDDEVNPGVTEVCDDDIDNDCDGLIDEECQQNGLVAYYPFNGIANDESGNGNHGTVYGAELINEDGPYRFDGENDYIKIPHSSSLDITDAITMAAWIFWEGARLDTSASVDCQRIISKRGDNIYTPESYTFWISGESSDFGDVAVRFDAPISDIYKQITFDSSLEPGQWYHLAVTYNGYITRLFVNGSEITDINAARGADSRDYFQGPINNTANHILIGDVDDDRFGEKGDDRFFFGRLDEIYIYSRALSENEVQNLYLKQ